MKTVRVLFILFPASVAGLLTAPIIATAQSCVIPRDPALIAANQARKDGRRADADKILWDARQATEQSAPDSPKMALYLKTTAGMNGTDAVADLQRAMEIDQKSSGPQSCTVAGDLYALANAYQFNLPAEAERLLKQVIDMLRDTPVELGLKSDAFAQLAELYRREKHLGDATAMYEQAVKACDPAKPITGMCDTFRSQLEDLYRQQGRVDDANRLLPTYRESDFAQLEELDRQGQEYDKNGLYPQAEETYHRGIAFIQQHPKQLFGILGAHFDMLGQILEREGHDSEAEQAYLQGLEVEENAAGPKPPQSLYIRFLSFDMLQNLYRRQGRLEEMEPIILHGLEIQEKYLPPDNVGISNTLTALADLYREEEKYAEAKPVYERLIAAREKNLGPDDSGLVPILTDYAGILRALHDDAGAATVQARINLLQLLQNRAVQQKGPN